MVTTLITTGKPTPCPTCGGSPEIESKEILKGEKRERAIRIAVNSKVFKDVLPSLIERGFRPSIKDAVAVLVKFKKSKCKYVRSVLVVVIPFKSSHKHLIGIISFGTFSNFKQAIAIIMDLKERKVSIVARSTIIERKGGGRVAVEYPYGRTITQGQPCASDSDCPPGYLCEYKCVEFYPEYYKCREDCWLKVWLGCLAVCKIFFPPPALYVCVATCTYQASNCEVRCYQDWCKVWEGECVPRS